MARDLSVLALSSKCTLFEAPASPGTTESHAGVSPLNRHLSADSTLQFEGRAHWPFTKARIGRTKFRQTALFLVFTSGGMPRKSGIQSSVNYGKQCLNRALRAPNIHVKVVKNVAAHFLNVNNSNVPLIIGRGNFFAVWHDDIGGLSALGNT